VTRKWFLTPKAVSQLADIYNYTFQKWSDDQAELYVQAMLNTFNSISTDQSLGRPITSEYQVEGRYVRCGKHFVYWQSFSDNTIGIAAILHERILKTERLRTAFGELPSN
jgi:toxin ParE1/3/4